MNMNDISNIGMVAYFASEFFKIIIEKIKLRILIYKHKK